ncbi:endo-1,3-beta-glucanase [Scheffersomyces xylosifermentans]|uniref:endo-1,3-beta-glucanase n=1 Tax=Scheffersomyces xylosifermentans TaxID=1304137 RepID=UPI00315D103D
MIFKNISTFGAILLTLGNTIVAEDVTITETKYIPNPCLNAKVQSILSDNPPGLTNGIPIVFVYVEDVEPTIEYSTVLATSQIEYPVSEDVTSTEIVSKCALFSCSTTTLEHIQSTIYITSAQVTYTTTTPKQAGTTSTTTATTDPDFYPDSESTIYQYETETTDIFRHATITKSAPTTTKTIFSATTVPSTLYKPSTSIESIASTLKDPLITGAPISKENEHIIDTDQYSEPLTISEIKKAKFSNTSDPTDSTLTFASNGTELSQILAAPITTSTIDLRISSSQASTRVASVPTMYSNDSLSESFSELWTLSSSDVVSSSSSTLSSSIVSSSDMSHSKSTTEVKETPGPEAEQCYSGDLFKVISTSTPLSVFQRDELPLSIPEGVSNDGVPYETNKFYANLFLGDQTNMIWSYPYGLYWKKVDYYGFGVQHTNVSDRVFGSSNTNNEGVASYYFNPTNNAELLLSATSLSESSNYMGVTEMKSMSALVTLSANPGDKENYIEIPVVQGMGFVTGVYHGNMVPLLNTLYGVNDLTQETSAALPSSILKYRATLFNGVQWLIYITLPNASDDFKLKAENPFNLEGSKAVDGLIIQLAVAPEHPGLEGFYDESAGQYVVGASIQGSVSCDSSAQYSFVYSSVGTSSCGYPIVFALPHHVESLTGATRLTSTGIKLASTTKGDMYGYLTNELTMSESLETDIQFLPWVQGMKNGLTYTSDQLKLLAQSANSELAVDIAGTVASMHSTYYSGKVIDKYSYILLVVSEILKDENVTNSTLAALKEAFEPFFQNKQYYPFIYDTKFGGLTSSASQGGDTGAEFGSGYYNDHHFHYGYYVHAAAVIGYIDKKQGGTWAEDNKEWVNTLIRDVANPSEEDTYFPVSRMFDWFGGHSWAAGLFASGDGKNEESSSEDYNFAYGMKMWGSVIGDNSMESRGDLMLAIMSRAMNKYFYYKSDNVVEPAEILPNKVSGIFFENKIAYTTYFGSPDQNPEYVHGIHMLPITPASSLIRIPSYVQEEWRDQVSTFIGKVNSGWTGILRLNQALYDAATSYSFFSSDSWSTNYLDNGQSRTWSLAFSGGISNSL